MVALAGGVWLVAAEEPPQPDPTTVPSLAPTSTTASTTVPTTQPPPAVPSVGGEVTVGVASEPVTLNPFLEGGGSNVVRLIGRTAWAGAIELDGVSHDPVPALLQELPTLDNGGLVQNEDGSVTVTYRIRPDARWEDGSPITGSDFEFTYRLIVDETLPIRPDVRAPYEAIVPDSLQTDPSTVRFDLIAPSLTYLDLFSIVVPVEQVEGSDFEADWNDRLWMSAGPFRFREWDPGRSITLDRNDAFWRVDAETGQQLPYLDRLLIEFKSSPEAVLDAFRSGTIDITGEPIDPALLDGLDSLDGVDLRIGSGPTWEHLSFQFGDGRVNRNPESLNDRLDFRRAVAHSVDRAGLVETIYGGRARVLDSPLGIMWPAAASDGWAAYRGDEKEAQQVLEALRAETDVSIPRATLTVNNSPPRAIAVGEYGRMFAGAGIALTVEAPEDTGVYFLETIGPGLFDLAEWAWIPTVGPAGAVADLRRWFLEIPEEGGSNFSRWPGAVVEPAGDVARLAALLEEVATEIDLESVRVRLAEIETLMADLVVTIPLYAEPNIAAVRTDAVGGYRHSIMPGGATWNAATWYRADG